jgi:3-oxoacyl-[acyl-carrier protein] reductase
VELEGQIAIVTGGSRGIGRAIALELGRAGATVVVNYARNEAAAQAVVDELGGKGKAVQADVGTADGCEALLAAADELGGLDILVNNAGITADNLVVRMTDDEWQRVMDTNAGGTFRMCRGAMNRMMRKRKGSIINIVSVAGIRGNPGQANYSASKAAVIGLTRTLAKEMGKRNIRVNAVAPGFVQTDMISDVSDAVIAEAKKVIPMRRLALPEDIAPVVLFLASPGSAYVTGQVIAVYGGMSV